MPDPVEDQRSPGSVAVEPQAGGGVEVDGGEREFYTVDRVGSLTEGQLVLATPLADLPQANSAELRRWYPDGLARHGSSYLFGSQGGPLTINTAIELLFEMVRRTDYPDAPSRFCSVFACDDLADARKFAQEHQIQSPGETKLWKVEHVGPRMRADMELLSLPGRPIDAFAMAGAYWSGSPIDQVFPGVGKVPFWEWLLVPPVQVVERVG